MEISPEIKNRNTIYSVIPLLVFTQKNKNNNLKRVHNPVFIVALYTIAKIWKQLEFSEDEWIKPSLQ